jgi:hypothetical protein
LNAIERLQAQKLADSEAGAVDDRRCLRVLTCDDFARIADTLR